MLGMIVSIWKKLHVCKKPPTDNTICRLGFLCVVRLYSIVFKQLKVNITENCKLIWYLGQNSFRYIVTGHSDKKFIYAFK